MEMIWKEERGGDRDREGEGNKNRIGNGEQIGSDGKEWRNLR